MNLYLFIYIFLFGGEKKITFMFFCFFFYKPCLLWPAVLQSCSHETRNRLFGVLTGWQTWSMWKQRFASGVEFCLRRNKMVKMQTSLWPWVNLLEKRGKIFSVFRGNLAAKRICLTKISAHAVNSPDSERCDVTRKRGKRWRSNLSSRLIMTPV